MVSFVGKAEVSMVASQPRARAEKKLDLQFVSLMRRQYEEENSKQAKAEALG